MSTGDGNGCPVCAGTYEHFIYGPDRATLDIVAGVLAQAGYLTPDPPEDTREWEDASLYADDGKPWLLTVYGSAARAFADGGRDDIEQACAAYGADYDGGGMYVGPLAGLAEDTKREPGDRS
jgi:hypothetical protein